jgi:membrane-associated protease RseP (regulator of RpoE activity)
LIESITRRTIPLKVKMIVQQVGVAALVLLVLVVSYNDIVRIFAN